MTRNDWEKASPSAFSILKSAESVIAGLILATLLWVGSTLQDTRLSLARLEVTMAAMQERIEERESVTGVTLTQHSSNFQTIWPRLRELKEKIDYLASKHGESINWRAN